MSEAGPGPVEAWFGADYARLHPLLQALHRDGGTLAGPVAIRFGRGLAGWLGRRQAARMRIPVSRDATVAMRVDIRSDGTCLHWHRTFDGSTTMRSTFTPVGHAPGGHWIEHVGALSFELGVDIVDGGWCWQPRRARFRGWTVPMWLMPRLTAHKRIVDGRYRFVVATSLPGLGPMLSYEGDLTAMACHT